MAEKKPMIVIKKINVVAAGHHGGSWKVALADFMTALMAFFLVMWLLAANAETKKAVSDYFSTPSIIEYNFQNFGVELTLEKLFLDLVNEPLKAFQSFMEPADKTPNVLDSGSQKVVMAYVADAMKEMARNFTVNEDGFEFDIPDYEMFKPGMAEPNAGFVNVLDRLRVITVGLEDANMQIQSMIFAQAVSDQSQSTASQVAQERADIVALKVKAAMESNTVDVNTGINVKDKKGEIDPSKLVGLIRFKIKQKPAKANGEKPRKLDVIFGSAKSDGSVYENFVQQAVGQRKAKKSPASAAAEKAAAPEAKPSPTEAGHGDAHESASESHSE